MLIPFKYDLVNLIVIKIQDHKRKLMVKEIGIRSLVKLEKWDDAFRIKPV